MIRKTYHQSPGLKAPKKKKKKKDTKGSTCLWEIFFFLAYQIFYQQRPVLIPVPFKNRKVVQETFHRYKYSRRSFRMCWLHGYGNVIVCWPTFCIHILTFLVVLFYDEALEVNSLRDLAKCFLYSNGLPSVPCPWKTITTP